MNRLAFIITILVMTACGSPNEIKEPEKESAIVLDKNMIGTWVNTTLFDSTLEQKRIAPWTNQFYGDLIIEIENNQTVLIEGNMDGGESQINVIDSNSFTITGRTDKPKVEFNQERNLLTLTTNNQSCLFRPLKDGDKIEIIGDEKAFSDFFKSRFFGDYSLRVEYLWSGFETYQPFDFDAIEIYSDTSEVEMYAWEFNKDTLILYNTIKSTDQESGFTHYNRGKLKEKKEKTAQNKG